MGLVQRGATMLENIWFIAAIWMGLAFIASLISTEDPHRGLLAKTLPVVVEGKYRTSLRLVGGCCFL
jgi:hypothetical protein